MPLTYIDRYTVAGVRPAVPELTPRTRSVRLVGGRTYTKGTVLGIVTPAAAADEVQTITITGTPTGGTFTISGTRYDRWNTPFTTSAIAYNASAATVAAALADIFGSGNITGAGGALPGTAVTITFGAALRRNLITLSIMTASGSFTGGSSPAIAITRTTAGHTGGTDYCGPYDDAASDGRQVAKYILADGQAVTLDGYCGGEFGGTSLTAQAYFDGVFDTSELTGIDANGCGDLGKIIAGSTSTLTTAGNLLRIGV